MVECTGLENRSAGNRTVGSNPTLSANFEFLRFRLNLERSFAPSGVKTHKTPLGHRGVSVLLVLRLRV